MDSHQIPTASSENVAAGAAAPEETNPNWALVPYEGIVKAEPIASFTLGSVDNPIDLDNLPPHFGPSSSAWRFPTRRSKRNNPIPYEDVGAPTARRGRLNRSPANRRGRGARAATVARGRGHRLHLIDEVNDDEVGDPDFEVPTAAKQISSDSEEDSVPVTSSPPQTSAPISTPVSASKFEGEHTSEITPPPTLSAGPSPPVSTRNTAAPSVDSNEPCVSIPDYMEADPTEDTEAPNEATSSPLDTLAEAALSAENSPQSSSTDSEEDPEEEPEEDWNMSLSDFVHRLDKQLKEDHPMETNVDARAASPDPAFDPNTELDNNSSGDDDNTEDDEDPDGKNLSAPYEVSNAFNSSFYFEADFIRSKYFLNRTFFEERSILVDDFDSFNLTPFLKQRNIYGLLISVSPFDPSVIREFYSNLQSTFFKVKSINFERSLFEIGSIISLLSKLMKRLELKMFWKREFSMISQSFVKNSLEIQ